MPDRNAKILTLMLGEVPLALYLLAGVYGALWVSDDFDAERFVAMAYVGVPAAILYYGARALYPFWIKRWPRAHALILTIMVVIFAGGVVPLINAATAEGPTLKRTVESGTRVVTRDVRRGGLGLLFKARW